ncbi:MAG: O-antigen ligase family protein [Bacteroidota bacterium]
MSLLDQHIPHKDHPWAKAFLYLLMLMIGIRISSYFTLFPDSIALTRVAKIGLRFLMTGLSIILLMMLSRQNPRYKVAYSMLLPMGLYLAYLTMGLLSVFWTNNPAYTVLQWFMTTETMVFSYVFYRLLCYYDGLYYGGPSFIWITNRSIFIIMVIFIAGIFIDPDTFFRGTHGGEVHRLGGYIINPNELGMLAVIGLTMVYLELEKKQFYVFNLISLTTVLAALLLSQSRSSLGAYLIVTGIFILRSKQYWIKAGSVVAGVFAIPVLVQTIILKTGDMDEIMSMTGRLPFWKDLIEIGFPKSPLYGFGFMNISPNVFSNKFPSIHSYAGAMTHNTFIQVLINLGLIGALICLLQMSVTCFAIYRSEDSRLRLLAACMLIPLMINSFTEFGIFGETNYGILFYQLLFMFFTLKLVHRPFPNTGLAV